MKGKIKDENINGQCVEEFLNFFVTVCNGCKDKAQNIPVIADGVYAKNVLTVELQISGDVCERMRHAAFNTKMLDGFLNGAGISLEQTTKLCDTWTITTIADVTNITKFKKESVVFPQNEKRIKDVEFHENYGSDLEYDGIF
ncbi:hypothetical protein GCK72_003191 [Caenorhabditis remanei]|uniref:Uncharacterized protein n=1 Tax=Caenorhabditis remanei TaxID=31234 RepID=A0A6A5HUR7_CAERE|nr:hypothetical protein GCK72_003191 [Caenorhabditis remanei]KAF1771365.1 hypothetical protein GCK72_003191 [Caenorhabditis remanei]